MGRAYRATLNLASFGAGIVVVVSVVRGEVAPAVIATVLFLATLALRGRQR